jgi:hypothetical protein
VAYYSQGVSVTWNGVAFSEVTDLQWSYGGGMPKGRDSAWTDELGSVSIVCLSMTNVATSQYGTLGDLVISGGGTSLTHKALYESMAVATELNGVTRNTVTFRLMDY